MTEHALRDNCEIYVRLNAVDDMISIPQWTLHMSFYGMMQVGISRSHFAAKTVLSTNYTIVIIDHIFSAVKLPQ